MRRLIYIYILLCETTYIYIYVIAQKLSVLVCTENKVYHVIENQSSRVLYLDVEGDIVRPHRQ